MLFLCKYIIGHISYFYLTLQVITSILQVLIYVIYLLLVDLQSIGIFILGVIILIYPIKKLISQESYDKTYYKTQGLNREIKELLENMFLIKILKKDEYELDRFGDTVSQLYKIYC